jgi:hypothetical protein
MYYRYSLEKKFLDKGKKQLLGNKNSIVFYIYIVDLESFLILLSYEGQKAPTFH